MNCEAEFEAKFIEKCMAMPVEEMGIYLIRCLKQITGERHSQKPVARATDTYTHLFDVFLQRANALPRESTQDKRKYDKLVDLWRSLEKKFEEACGLREYVPLPKKGPKRKILIYDDGWHTFGEKGSCFDCGSPNIHTQYGTSIGTLYFCSPCNKELRSILGPKRKPVDMWSKMIFSSFESNRRKH